MTMSCHPPPVNVGWLNLCEERNFLPFFEWFHWIIKVWAPGCGHKGSWVKDCGLCCCLQPWPVLLPRAAVPRSLTAEGEEFGWGGTRTTGQTACVTSASLPFLWPARPEGVMSSVGDPAHRGRGSLAGGRSRGRHQWQASEAGRGSRLEEPLPLVTHCSLP